MRASMIVAGAAAITRESGPASGARTAAGLVEGVIRERLPFLKISPDVLDAFARDCVRYDGRTVRSARQASGARDRLVERFLLSTDFFQHGADESRPVRYVTYADPYISPCYNPFAPSS